MSDLTTAAPRTHRDRAERRRLLETVTGVPATEGNHVDVLRDGDEIFPAMLDAIAAAEHTVDFMTFVWWTGPITERFAEAFIDRARAGVRVRVLLDGFGARKIAADQRDRMRDAGVQVVEFRPFPSWRVWRMNLRTHRRVLVCDGRVAFTGGVGIAQEWVDEADADVPGWRDTHFRVRGPAIAGIHAAFLSNWMENQHETLHGGEGFPVQPTTGSSTVQVVRGASQVGWNDMAIALQALTELAEDRIRITSAYFRPPASLRRSLVDAARDGLDVDVLVPGPHAEPMHYRWAGEHHYAELLRAGVRIWHYQPTMLHAKLVTVDHDLAFVGTTNIDARSIAINEQVGLVIHDPEVVDVLDDHFDDDLADSREITAEAWADRSLPQRAVQATSHALTYAIRGAGAIR